MSRPTITHLLILALILCSNPSDATRPVATTVTKQQNKDGVETIEESCQGIDEDECLMRRTLVAHIDYIYTQKKNP
ncbi:phytosulfokines 3-like [Bidens hawaiensis]|uniref:phytosulfokines 3-like n=1 Tax=Bidens hawaiensis TaxID=980011 RepID=UPI00404B8438